MTALPKIANRVKTTLGSAPGTGSLTLGPAVAGFQTFAEGGFVTGDLVSYVIEDGAGVWEIGTGAFNATAGTLARGAIQSSNADSSPISASATATVYSTILAQFVAAPFDGVLKLAGAAVSTSNPLPVGVSFPATQAVTWTSDAGVNLLQGGTPTSTSNPLPMRLLVPGGEVSTSTPLPVSLSGSGSVSVQPSDLSGFAIKAADSAGLKVQAPMGGLPISGTVTLSNPYDGTLKLGGSAVSGSNPLPISVVQAGIDTSQGLKVQWSPSAVVNLYQSSQPVTASNPLANQMFFATPSGMSTYAVSNANPLPVAVLSGGSGGSAGYTTAQIGSLTLNGGANAVAPSSFGCSAVEIYNDTGTDIQYTRSGNPSFVTIPNGGAKIIGQISNANALTFRRRDLSTTSVTITVEYLS